jgi:hypothetical protein
MRLNLDTLTVPPHPSEVDRILILQDVGDAITEARNVHRDLIGELQESKRSTIPTRAIALSESEPVLSDQVAVESTPEVDRPPKRVSRRVGIHSR